MEEKKERELKIFKYMYLSCTVRAVMKSLSFFLFSSHDFRQVHQVGEL